MIRTTRLLSRVSRIQPMLSIISSITNLNVAISDHCLHLPKLHRFLCQQTVSSYGHTVIRQISSGNKTPVSKTSTPSVVNVMPHGDTSLYDILKDKLEGRKGLEIILNSPLTWDDVLQIKKSVNNDKDQFKLEAEKTLKNAGLNPGDAGLFAVYLTVEAFSPKTLSSVAQDMIGLANECKLSQDKRDKFQTLARFCDDANSLRSTVDVKFNPFPLEIATIPPMSRSPQVCEVFERIQEKSNCLENSESYGFCIREVMCSVSGPGSGKTHFLNCLVDWCSYKDDILSALKSHRRSSQAIIEMVENENLMTCGASFTNDCKVSDDELNGLEDAETFWLRILFQEMCKAGSDFNSFRSFFLQHPKMKCLLCNEFVIQFVKKRNGCEYVLLLIDDLISCLENADRERKVYYLTNFLREVGRGQFDDKKISLFTTSIWHSPMTQFDYPPHNLTRNIKLPNMKDVAIDIVNRVHEISNGTISLSEALMLATSVTFHPRAIEQLMIFAGGYSSHKEEDDILTAFSKHIYACVTLSWKCAEVDKFINPAIFLTRLNFTSGELREMGVHMLNSVERCSVVPFLSPIHLFQRDDAKQLVRQGLNITQRKGIEKFIANWICVRYNMYDPGMGDENMSYAMRDVFGVEGIYKRTCRKVGRHMEACDIPRLRDLQHLEPSELSCRVYVPESNSDEGIDLIAFFPKDNSDKMIVLGMQNKMNLADCDHSASLCPKEILEGVLKSTESLLYWHKQGHDVYLWIPCWKAVSKEVKSKLNRARDKWENVKNDTTSVEMMLGLAESDAPMTLMSKKMANFAGMLADRTTVSGKEDLREGIFGQSIAWFMDGGEVALKLGGKLWDQDETTLIDNANDRN